MAKISARGATEVARCKTTKGDTFVLRSDGVILRKASYDRGFKLYHFSISGKANRTESYLRAAIERIYGEGSVL